MVLSVLPASAIGAVSDTVTRNTTPVYVRAGSDFQGKYESNTHIIIDMQETIKQILQNTGRKSFNGFLVCGDYSLGGDDYTANTPRL